MSRIRSFLREARRRRIFTTAVAYLVLAAGLIQLGSSIFPALGVAQGTTVLIVLLGLGFPMVIVLAWIFDIGPGGLKRTLDMLGGDDGTPPASPVSPQMQAARTFGGVTAQRASTPPPVEIVDETPDPERVRRASLAFVRHELRTPINAILGYSEMLLEDADEAHDTAAAADLTRIVACAREIHALVDGILDADRISSEQGRDLDSYGEQIRADLRDPLGAVVGYTEMLMETAREQDNEARIADLQRVLTASHRLVGLSNDIATVATRAGEALPAEMVRGATLAGGVLARIRAVQGAHSQPDRQGSLLVVDDSADNRELLAKQLARKGYFVAAADSGAAALDMMNGQAFDLVLLDVLMPDLDGVGVLLRMKNDPRLADIPVIMISALDEVDSIVRCLEIGAADFVSKPFHPTLLDARINSARLAHAARHNGAAGDGGSAGSAMARMMAGTLPLYVRDRLARGETRLLDGVSNAAAYFVDVEHAVAASSPAERAVLTETLIESAHRACEQEGAKVLLHGIGLAMVAGFPEPEADAAARIARTALAFTRRMDASGIKLRSGVHVGAVYAAVVGKDNLSFWIWGDAIDLSRRLALSAERGSISISAAAFALLREDFSTASRGVVEVAGRGQMRAYVLETELAAARA